MPGSTKTTVNTQYRSRTHLAQAKYIIQKDM